MKSSFIKSLGFALLAGLAITSCGDKCKDVNCGANGTCNEGDCICDAGYEGASCETKQALKFIGSYTVAEDCSLSNPSTYIVAIFENPSDITKINIVNFWGEFLNPVVATINADGKSFTIPDQEPDSDGFRVQGSGTISDNGKVITLNYSVKSGTATTDQCTNTVYTKP